MDRTKNWLAAAIADTSRVEDINNRIALEYELEARLLRAGARRVVVMDSVRRTASNPCGGWQVSKTESTDVRATVIGRSGAVEIKVTAMVFSADGAIRWSVSRVSDADARLVALLTKEAA